MLLIKTRLWVSSIRGIGLFANENIKKGTIIGINKDDSGIIHYSEKEWSGLENNLGKESFLQIKKYAYKQKKDKLYYLNLDDTRFINHSKSPNIASIGDNDVAIRDIKIGDEILIDYNTFYDNEYFKEIMTLK